MKGKHIARETRNHVTVSTVEIPVEANHPSPLLVFESRIFGGLEDGSFIRTKNIQAALRAHRELCEKAFGKIGGGKIT